MRRSIRRVTFLLAVLGGVVGRLPAQADRGDGRGVAGGAEFRGIRIDDSLATTIQQWSVPVGAVANFGRLTVELGTAYASSRVEARDRPGRTVSSFTDTQAGLTYSFGRDLLVAFVVVNLPTGLDQAPPADFAVLGAISSPLFGFPVNAHGNGFFTTTGLALAVPAGAWNIGIAGSARVSAQYTPYVDVTGPFSYKAGVEGRVRLGADRLVGRSRLTGGFTYSTFGTDEYGTGSVSTGLYRPGGRWFAEATGAVPVGARASLSFSAWHYRREAGDSVGVVVSNQEQISGIAAAVTSGLWSGTRLTMGISSRFSTQDQGNGHLYGGEIGLGLDLGSRVTFTPAVRYDLGRLTRLEDEVDVHGFGLSVLLRVR